MCRELLREHDEILQVYRRHFYNLRRLILLGSPERKLLILRELLQVSWLLDSVADWLFLRDS